MKTGHFERKYQIGLFGVFGFGNFGNDATLEACLTGMAGVPASRIVCVAANPSKVASTYGIASFEITSMPSLAGGGGRVLGPVRRVIGEMRNLLRAWSLLRRVRTFVVAGTGVLDDQHVRPTQLPLEVFRWSLAARLAGARLVFLSVGAGPIDQWWSRVLLTLAVRLADEVSYRDGRSKEFMRSLGRDVQEDRVIPDLVFASAAPAAVARAPSPLKRRIAVGVLGRVNWQGRPEKYVRYEGCLVQLIAQLAGNGWEVRVVVGDAGDVDTQLAIARRAELKGLAVVSETTGSFDDVVGVLNQCDAMVASRYHNVVAAILVGIPVISLGYGPKNVALLEQLDVAAWGHDIDDFRVDSVVAQIREACAQRRVLYRAQTDRYRELLKHEFALLTNA